MQKHTVRDSTESFAKTLFQKVISTGFPWSGDEKPGFIRKLG